MILMIYNEQICKEILLPNIYDSDYRVRLHAEDYALRENIELDLERSTLGWKITAGNHYQVFHHNIAQSEHMLRNEEILDIRSDRGDQLKLLVADVPISFHVMRKYDLRQSADIYIGHNPDNNVCYSFMGLVSGFHASIRRSQHGSWVLEDSSTNGVFLSNKRVRGQRKLQFGDHIDIFGLHILYMGTMLLVGSNCGELTVDEGKLTPFAVPEIDREKLTRTPVQEENYFNRAPRNLTPLYSDPVSIEDPPAPRQQKRKPAYMVIGPAFSMAIPMTLGCMMSVFASQMSGRGSGAFMYTGLVTALGSAIIGTIWAILNLNYEKKTSTQEEEQRFNAYSNYLIGIAEKLRAQYTHNSAALNRIYPPAQACLSYGRNSVELWNRNYTQEDFLYERLGLGDAPFQVDITIPPEKFNLINDTLQSKPRTLKDEFSTLHNVPIGINLMKEPLIGLIGGYDRQGAISMMHTLTAEIAAAQCYTDVKLVYIYDEENLKHLSDWECMRWFPHVWSEDKTIRFMAGNEMERSDIFFHLSNVLRTRQENASESTKKVFQKPHYVIFIENPAWLEGEILAKYIYDAQPQYGITTFLMVESLDQLPNAVETVIENDGRYTGVYNLMDVESTRQHTFAADTVDRTQLEQFGRTLANIHVKEMESSSEIPSSLTFFEMYGVGTLDEFHVMDRWRKNRNYNSMRALIGRKAGDTDCYLDIHEKFHGPHGLIAGTTGSGKSETLQTYILSLAINFSPEDVSFFIIDFKGGGMANLFSGLPHMAGQISNLSGNQVRRAMISIKSENTRRQRIFAANGVNNINLYTKLYKNHEADVPVPHLFIIIDEFAELKREEPEFMDELISVAQVGRSLGVHLILATQKPSGTVDNNIWSNSKFRLCLRVQDRQDSMDMLGKPDAAFLTQVGRGYLQVGNDEIYELFQSGYSGAAYTENTSGVGSSTAMISRTGKTELIGSRKKADSAQAASGKVKETTQLDAVIAYLDKIAGENGYHQSAQLWLPVLGTNILLSDLKGGISHAYEHGYAVSSIGKNWVLEAVVGQYDDPEQQAQRPLTVNFSDHGHMAVCGSVVSGKSTFLQTMLFSFMCKYSPAELQMYLIDFSSHMLGAFEKAPHVGGVVSDDQEDRLDKFFHLITVIMNERRGKLSGGNYSQYVQANGVTMPAIFVVLDNYASFRTKTSDKYENVLMRIAREGVGYGIFLILTAQGFGMNEIPSRLGDNLRTVISLEQQDKFKYMDVLRKTHLQILPETNVKGRGLAEVGDRVLEFQTALSIDAQDDFSRMQLLQKWCEERRAEWKGAMAKPIPEIPENPTLELLAENEDYITALRNADYLPFGYFRQDASIAGFDLRANYCMSVTGKARTGKTNVLRLLMYAAYKKGADMVVFEKNDGGYAELQKLAVGYGARYVSDSSAVFSYFSDLLPEFVRRNKIKRSILDRGGDETEVYETLRKEKPIILFIADMSEFMEMVYKPGQGVGSVSGFLENITDKGRLHNIYMIAALKSDDEGLLLGYRAYNNFVSAKKGIHLGGNLSSQKLFNFQNIPFAQQAKTSKKGFGFVSSDEEEGVGIEVVIPLAK